jgi:hypothetical protein
MSMRTCTANAPVPNAGAAVDTAAPHFSYCRLDLLLSKLTENNDNRSKARSFIRKSVIDYNRLASVVARLDKYVRKSGK